MSWIKMREDLFEDPAVLKMAAKLGTRPEHVVGYLHRFWGWVSRNVSLDNRDKCPSGSVTGVPLLSLESVLNVPGFLSLLIDAGWLEYSEDGPEPVITVPKFDRHLSDGAKQRALNAEKKRFQRAKAAETTQKAVPNVQGQMSRMSRDKCPSETGTREEKRREEKNTTNTTPNPSASLVGGANRFVPDGVDLPFASSEFADAWREWCQHRRDLRKPLTRTSTTRQLREFASWGEARAIAALRHTVGKGWQGIVEPPPTRNGHALHCKSTSIVDQVRRKLSEAV